MRNNGPVTGREVYLKEDDQLVTSTNTKGVITFCNDTFCDIAGFDHDELLNQAYNVVRHPQMPPAAFSMLWTALKAAPPVDGYGEKSL